MVVLPETDCVSAQCAMERIKQILADYNVSCQPDRKLSLSIGYACGYQGCLLSDVFKEADQEMYKQKAANKMG